MRTYALEYEFGERRQITPRLPECLFFAGDLKLTQEAIEAHEANAAQLADLAKLLEDPIIAARWERAKARMGPHREKPAVPLLPTALPGLCPAADAYQKTDLGNTDYFVELFGDEIRYDQSRKRWLIWREHRWEPDLLKKAEQAAQHAARKRLLEALAMPSGMGRDPARENAIRWAVHSEGRYRIESVLSLAQKTTKLSVQTASGWDEDPWLLGVPNGVMDLRTGALRAGRQDDRITKHTGAEFDSTATCPRFEQFLNEVLGGDAELVQFMRRAIGYTASGDVSEDCWFGCYGDGRNGKSTLFEVLHRVLGDYSYAAPFSLVESGKGDSRRDFDIAYLQSKRFVMASETREGGVWDEERLKKLSGGDVLHAEIKHGAEFDFWPSHKLWFMFNHQPRVRDHSTGFWRRVRLIPFTQKFEGVGDDKTLDMKLASERVGILAWVVRACLEWQKSGLTIPQAVRSASQRYEQEEDPLSGFVPQHARLGGAGFYLRDVYALYRQWAKTEHLDHPLGKGRFGQLLEARGFKRDMKNNRPYFENGTLVYVCTCMSAPCVCLGVVVSP